MSIILVHLQKVHKLVHDSQLNSSKNLLKKKDFSEPKIYTGGVNILLWSNLSEAEKKVALSKKWYIYYTFRNKESGKLERMPNIKGNANTLKSKKERLDYLLTLKSALEYLLEKDFNPRENNDIESLLRGEKSETPIKKIMVEKVEVKPVAVIPTEKSISIKDAFEITLNLKKNMMNETSFQNFQGRINKFKKSLTDISRPINSIAKKDVVIYLNDILERTSPRNRNNNRTDLSSFFKELENNEFINDNFVTKIPILKAIPERNKTFSDALQKDIYDYLEVEDNSLLLFIKFISYGFLRPIEVCRLKIKDIDLVENKLHVRAKNQPVKTKIIPEILLNELPDLSVMNPDHYLFTPNGYAMECETKENNRRDYFSKRFNEVVKKKFELDKDYGLYSFRHTYITRLYRKLRETNTPQVAKSNLMLITGHSTVAAVDKYLRDIDAELPEDYSHYLK
jgi:integrase